MRVSLLAAPAALAVLAGCEPTAPASPSFQVDVMPILAANCVRCHGAPPLGGAPVEFRLDSFGATVLDNQGTADEADDVEAFGAADYGPFLRSRLIDSERPMPPRFPLDDWQIDTLLAWGEADPPTRGEPRPGNQRPVLTLAERTRDATSVTLAYELHDPDGDLVVGELCDDEGAGCLFLAPLSSGRGEVRLDTTLSGAVMLKARLDDGAGYVEETTGLVLP